ncbi:MAG: Crp/Fnr family transcriptional regulator [Clostridia bacterium]|nr:Crp/Fnr family transcriptional regulator [Clostridia bacterium]
MSLAEYFPVFEKLTAEQQKKLLAVTQYREVKKGTVLHDGNADCLGLVIVHEGQFRAHMTSEDGREITLYRLFDRDICLFTAACIMRNLQFDVTITAQKDSKIWIIPPVYFRELKETSAPVANYTNDLMATRFTDVMWLIEQIMWRSFDKRLADFLLEECSVEGTDQLKITHENIANHMGTAREVVTRMLKYFQNEGMVALTRGTITVLDHQKLEELLEL